MMLSKKLTFICINGDPDFDEKEVITNKPHGFAIYHVHPLKNIMV